MASQRDSFEDIIQQERTKPALTGAEYVANVYAERQLGLELRTELRYNGRQVVRALADSQIPEDVDEVIPRGFYDPEDVTPFGWCLSEEGPHRTVPKEYPPDGSKPYTFRGESSVEAFILGQDGAIYRYLRRDSLIGRDSIRLPRTGNWYSGRYLRAGRPC
jgi:hypothetical protein